MIIKDECMPKTTKRKKSEYLHVFVYNRGCYRLAELAASSSRSMLPSVEAYVEYLREIRRGSAGKRTSVLSDPYPSSATLFPFSTKLFGLTTRRPLGCSSATSSSSSDFSGIFVRKYYEIRNITHDKYDAYRQAHAESYSCRACCIKKHATESNLIRFTRMLLQLGR